MKELTTDHLLLAGKVGEWNKGRYWMNTSPKRAIALFLAEQFFAEDESFDVAGWMKACGLADNEATHMKALK